MTTLVTIAFALSAALAAPVLAQDAGKAAPPYQEVLAAPADVPLNFRYAQALVAQGKLVEAAATLERVLAFEPRHDEARRLYAETMRRLERARLRTRAQVRLTAGPQWDSNRNNGPLSGRTLFFDTPLTADGDLRRRSDAALITTAYLQLRRPLGGAAPELFGSYSYYRADQHEQSTQDMQSHAGEAGAAWRAGGFGIETAGTVGRLTSAGAWFRAERGGELRASRPIGAGEWHGRASGVYQDYRGDASGRSGPDWTIGTGGRMPLTRSHSVGLDYNYELKRAADRALAYRRHAGSASWRWELAKGRAISASFSAAADDYDTPLLSVSAKRRRDVTLRARPTFTAPLSRSVRAEASYEYLRARSTLPNFEYQNHQLSAQLSYQWSL